jgi:hypothetical protein
MEKEGISKGDLVCFDVISHDPRATTTELQKRSSKTGNRKKSGESQNVCGRRDNGRTEMGKNSQRKYGKQHRTGHYLPIKN